MNIHITCHFLTSSISINSSKILLFLTCFPEASLIAIFATVIKFFGIFFLRNNLFRPELYSHQPLIHPHHSLILPIRDTILEWEQTKYNLAGVANGSYKATFAYTDYD